MSKVFNKYVIFVGDKPSKTNIDPDVAFVGTKSYDKLCSWIPKLDISLNDIVICNKKDIKSNSYKNPKNVNDFRFEITTNVHIPFDPKKGDKVIALGAQAALYLDDIECEHFMLPHPSGLNRKLNDKKFEAKILRECREFIYG